MMVLTMVSMVTALDVLAVKGGPGPDGVTAVRHFMFSLLATSGPTPGKSKQKEVQFFLFVLQRIWTSIDV